MARENIVLSLNPDGQKLHGQESVLRENGFERSTRIVSAPNHETQAGLSIPTHAALRHMRLFACSDKPVFQGVSNRGQINHSTSALLSKLCIRTSINRGWKRTSALRWKWMVRKCQGESSLHGRLSLGDSRTWKATAIIMRSGTRCNRHWPL